MIPRKYQVPVALSLALCTVLYFTMSQYGVSIDELTYFDSGTAYASWLEHPRYSRIDSVFTAHAANGDPRNRHPPFGMILGGLASHVFHDSLGAAGEIAAFRLQNLAYCFVLCFVTYLWMSELANAGIAMLAVLVVFFLPRLYFRSHLATLDYPVTALMFAASYAFWKGTTNPKYVIVSAVVLGLALLTKINAVFLFGFLTTWLLVTWRGQLRARLSYVLPFVAIPPAMLVALWPWLWSHPVARIVEYFLRIKNPSVPIPVYYLGHTYLANDVPWHFPFTVTVVTLPCAVLLCCVLFVIRMRKRRPIDLFLLFSAMLPIVLIAFLSPAKDAGVRLFLPAFPFICLIASLGAYEVLRVCTWKNVTLTALALVLSAGFAVGRYQRNQDSYYNELVAFSGISNYFERACEVCAYLQLVPWLNERSAAKIYVPVGQYGLQMQRNFGGLRDTIAFCKKYDTDRPDPYRVRPSVEEADYVVLLVSKSRFDSLCWDYYLHDTPVYTVGDGIVNVYVNKEKR
ncbi:MAG: ArnT family glycosyltransferase [Candidatus Brocadiia bacterium]